MSMLIQFYQQQCSPFDKIFYKTQLASLLLSGLFILINSLFTHYIGVPYAKWQFFLVLPFLCGLSAITISIQEESPYLYNIVHSYSQYWVFLIINTLLLQGIQYTPFATIDHTLVHFDQSLHFNTVNWLQWTHNNDLAGLLNFFYNLIHYELFFLPGILLFFITRYRFERFLLAFALATIFSEVIYYFFPTTAPASMFSSPLFPPTAEQTFIKFNAVHQALTYPYPSGTGGLIAFPSLHVIVGVMFIYLCIDKRWLLSFIGTANTLLILSTILLGWHYLVDVLAAIIISIICIVVAHKWIRHADQKQTSIDTAS